METPVLLRRNFWNICLASFYRIGKYKFLLDPRIFFCAVNSVRRRKTRPVRSPSRRRPQPRLKMKPVCWAPITLPSNSFPRRKPNGNHQQNCTSETTCGLINNWFQCVRVLTLTKLRCQSKPLRLASRPDVVGGEI